MSGPTTSWAVGVPLPQRPPLDVRRQLGSKAAAARGSARSRTEFCPSHLVAQPAAAQPEQRDAASPQRASEKRAASLSRAFSISSMNASDCRWYGRSACPAPALAAPALRRATPASRRAAKRPCLSPRPVDGAPSCTGRLGDGADASARRRPPAGAAPRRARVCGRLCVDGSAYLRRQCCGQAAHRRRHVAHDAEAVRAVRVGSVAKLVL